MPETLCDSTIHAFCRLVFIFILYAVNTSVEICFLTLLILIKVFNRKNNSRYYIADFTQYLYKYVYDSC